MTLQQLPGKPRGRGSESGSTSFSRGLGRSSPAKALRFVRLGAACCQADCKVEGPDESAPPSFRKLKTCLAKGGGFPLLVLLLLRSLQRVGEQGLLRGGFPSLWGPLEHLPKLSHATTKLRLVRKKLFMPSAVIQNKAHSRHPPARCQRPPHTSSVQTMCMRAAGSSSPPASSGRGTSKALC